MSQSRTPQRSRHSDRGSLDQNDPGADRQPSQSSQMSNRSPIPPISRTPTADRQLLRTLTVSPDNDDIHDGGVSPEPSVRHSTQSRHPPPTEYRQPTRVSTRQSVLSEERTPTASFDGSPNRTTNQSRTSVASERLQLPEAPKDIKGEDWQSGKTVSQCNHYMLKYEVTCDVTFVVGEAKEEIRAHKYMLMSRSPVLFKALIKHMGNSDVNIGVPDIKPEIFRDLLQYIYTDEFDIHTGNVSSMLFSARKFQLKGLSDMCFQYLDAEMHDETVAKIMEQAHIYNETGLYDKCVRYICTHAEKVLRKPSFGELCSDCVARLIKSDDLRALEEAVFEGCLIWAGQECRRQKKQPSDENKRQVLGKLLYLIRFPIMDVTYFTQKVSLGQLLTHDETLSIFQYFHGEEQQLPNRFSRNERNRIPRNVDENPEPLMLSAKRSPNMSHIRRFTSTDGSWKQNGPPDAITFTVSQAIVLYGVEIYGTTRGSETYSVKLLIYDDINREEIRKNDASIFTNTMKDTYEVYLARPVRIPPRRAFTAVLIMKGAPTTKGVDGVAEHVVDGVTFELSSSNRSSNGTDVTVGQIPGLLFNKTQ